MKTMIKLIAIDMDGTLLSPNGRVPAQNAAALRRLLTYGIRAVVCTGRSPQDAFIPLHEAGIFVPVISMNGAACYDAAGRLEKTTALSEADVRRILEQAECHSLIVDLMTDEGSITTAAEPLFRTCFEAGELLPTADMKYDDICSRFRFTSAAWVLAERPRIYKASLIALGERKERLREVRALLSTSATLSIASSAENNLELTDEGATKGQALKAYAKAQGIRLSETGVVGDSENDLSMFRLPVGLKAAMGNAAGCICREADLITEDNAHAGVALLLNRVLEMDGEAADVIELFQNAGEIKTIRNLIPSVGKTAKSCMMPA